jgi:TolB protein
VFSSSTNLYIADVSGSGLVRLTNNTSCGDVHPAWSPDGTKIAFASCHNGTNVAIYVIGADGSNLTMLTDGVSHDYRPTWSPDGLRIAFQSERAGNLDVWVMDADGGNPVNLTPDNPGFDTAPKWNSVRVTP